MTTYYAKSAGSILVANAWNTASNGSGTDATFADGNAAGHTLDLNGLAMTSPNGTTLTCTLLQATTGTLTPTGTLTINGNATYSGTATSGMFIVGTDAAVTVNGVTTETSTGYAVVTSGNGTFTASNAGSTAISLSGTGRVVSAAGTGAIAVTGNVSATNGGTAVYCNSSSAGHSLNGNLSNSSYGSAWQQLAGTLAWTPSGTGVTITGGGEGGLYVAGTGVVNINAVLVTSVVSSRVSAYAVGISAGTVNYYGTYSLGASANCEIVLAGGTLNLVKQATPYTPLVLTNSGTFLIQKNGGTLNTTGNAGASLASIVNAVAPSASGGGFAAITGGTDAQKGIISGPVIPAGNKVKLGSGPYGYASSQLTPDYYPPNLDNAPGTENAAAVLASAHYGEANAVAGTRNPSESSSAWMA